MRFRLNNKQIIMRHLHDHGSISPMEALVIHKIVRLAPRIEELRKQGHKIETHFNYDRDGVRYARYVLA